MNDPIPCYLGRKACGCVVAVHVDDPEDSPEVKRLMAKDVAGWLRTGLVIERSTVAEFRKSPFGCKCEQPAPTKPSRPVWPNRKLYAKETTR